MSDANTPPGDAALTDDEIARIEARLNLYIERGGPFSEIMYFEDFVPFNDVRRLVAELRRLRAENAELRSALPRFIVGDVVRISDNSKVGIVELISERYGAFVRTDTSALWIDFGLLKHVDAAEKPPRGTKGNCINGT